MSLENESLSVEKTEPVKPVEPADVTTQNNLAASATGGERQTILDEAEPAETVIVVPPAVENSEPTQANQLHPPSRSETVVSTAAVARTVTIMRIPTYGIEASVVAQDNTQEEGDASAPESITPSDTDKHEEEIPLKAASEGGGGGEEPPLPPPTGGEENEDGSKKSAEEAVTKASEAQSSGDNAPAEESPENQAEPTHQAALPPSPKEESLPARPKKEVADLPPDDRQELARISQMPITEHQVATRDSEEGTDAPAAPDTPEEELDVRALRLADSELQYMRTTNAYGETTAWVMGVNVPDHLQGFGVGARLLEDLAARCVADDIQFIESLTVSESGLHAALRVFGEETTEFYDPRAAEDDHAGWEGRKDVIPLTPIQARDSIKLGRERANEAWAVEGGSVDNGVYMRTNVQKYFAIKLAKEAHSQEKSGEK